MIDCLYTLQHGNPLLRCRFKPRVWYRLVPFVPDAILCSWWGYYYRQNEIIVGSENFINKKIKIKNYYKPSSC